LVAWIVAVNNAGTEGTPGPVTNKQPKLRRHFDTNVSRTLLSMSTSYAYVAQGHGSIVNVSSTYVGAGAAGALSTLPASTRWKV